MEISYDGSIESLLGILDDMFHGTVDIPRQAIVSRETKAISRPWHGRLIDISGGAVHGGGVSLTPSFFGAFDLPIAHEFAKTSIYAYTAFLYGWMSELPVEAALLRYGLRVLQAADRAAADRAASDPRAPNAHAADRTAADTAASDRGDEAVAATLDAAHKTRREVHRLAGLLRFEPVSGGRFEPMSGGAYTALCAPDHFVLPPLAQHFYRRFGDTPWAIIDEKRSLGLFCRNGRVSLEAVPEAAPHENLAVAAPHENMAVAANVSRETTATATPSRPSAADWEALWKQYHRVINNEGRTNSALQRQFMPKRYWGYLPEMDALPKNP
jgi:probable DNA metabolism protein